MEEKKDDKPKLALRIEDIYNQQEEKEEDRRVIIFRLADEFYGLDLSYVKEVAFTSRITRVPFADGHILGVMNLRGDIISVTDLRVLFSLKAGQESEEKRMIVIEHEMLSTALWVDQVVEIAEIPVSKFQEAAMLTEKSLIPVESQVEWNGHLIAVIDSAIIIQKTRLKAEND